MPDTSTVQLLVLFLFMWKAIDVPNFKHTVATEMLLLGIATITSSDNFIQMIEFFSRHNCQNQKVHKFRAGKFKQYRVFP